MKLGRYKQEIFFTILSSLPGKLGGKTYSDFIKLLTGASRVAIVIATAILTLAYVNCAAAATACEGAQVGLNVQDSTSRVYSNCGNTTTYATMGISNGYVFMVARTAVQLNPSPGTKISVGAHSSWKLKAMAADYSGDCSEIDYSGVTVDLIRSVVNTRYCGVEGMTNGYAIFIKADYAHTTSLFSNASVVYSSADTAAPTLSSSSPTDNATNVAVTSNIVLTFSEAVARQTGNITIKKTSDNSTVETIDVTSGGVTGTGTATITINPTSDLASSTEYYVLIDATAFDDLAGNSYAGISSTTALSFTTISTALPNPLEDKEVLGFIKTQNDKVARVAGQSMRSVKGRLTQLISAPRDSLANNSHQGIRLGIADTNLNDVLSSISSMSGLNSSADIFNNGWAIWTEGSVLLGKVRGNSGFNIVAVLLSELISA